MLLYVHFLGCVSFAIAAFSAGSPNASKATGNSTFEPCIRRQRAAASDGDIAYQCPMCRSPLV